MEPSAIFEAHQHYVLSLVFSPDSQMLASSGVDGGIKIWSAGSWQHLGTIGGHDNSVNAIAISPDGRLLASGSSDATVRLWSFPDGELVHTLQDRKKSVIAVTFSGDGRLVAAASHGRRAPVWGCDGRLVRSILAGTQNLSSVALSPDGHFLATAGLVGDISVWSLPKGQLVATLATQAAAAGSLQFIDSGRELVSLGYQQDVIMWDTVTWQRSRTYAMDRWGVRSLVVSPDEALLGLGMRGMLQLRSTIDMELQAELAVSTPVVSAIAFSPDGQWLAVAAADRRVRIWRLRRWV